MSQIDHFLTGNNDQPSEQPMETVLLDWREELIEAAGRHGLTPAQIVHANFLTDLERRKQAQADERREQPEI